MGGDPCFGVRCNHHCTMYGVTKLVTEVTKLVTHERKFDGWSNWSLEMVLKVVTSRTWSSNLSLGLGTISSRLKGVRWAGGWAFGP